MKSYLIVCFFFCVAVVVSSEKCTEQSECKKGQCCSGIPPFGGSCKDLTVAGGKCHIEPKTVPIFGDFVIGPCPCVEGLKCIQQGEKENEGVCQDPTVQQSMVKSKKSGSTTESLESTEEVTVVKSAEATSAEESADDASNENPAKDYAPDFKKFIDKFKFKGSP